MGLISRVSSRTYRLYKKTMAAKQIDWSKLSWAMTKQVQVGAQSTSMFENGAARYSQLKTASDAVLARHTAANARPKSIDWAAYKAALPKQSAWVDKMQKEFTATKIPAPVDNYSQKISQDDAKFAEVIAKNSMELDEAAKEAKSDLNVLAQLPPAQQMTMADIYKFLPELNAQSEAEMEANKWEPGMHVTTNPDLVGKAEEDAKAVRAEVKPGYFAAKW